MDRDPYLGRGESVNALLNAHASTFGGWMKDRKAIVLLTLFGMVWAMIVIPNHLNFRTYCLDLGLYTHVAYDYAHGRMDMGTMFMKTPMPILADHFDLHLMLWAPLTYLFGSWTLLLVQWISVILGAVGIHRLAQHLYSKRSALIALIVFCISWGIYSALSYDYHSSVVASMAVPWLAYAIASNRVKLSWFLLAFILVAKENMGFWVLFLAVGAYFVLKQLGRERKQLLWMAMVGSVYSVLICGWIMPALTPDGNYAHFNYSVIGDGLTDLLVQAVTAPHKLLYAFIGDPDVMMINQVKVETIIVFLIAGGWACAVNPRFLLMVIPLFVFKMWNDYERLWTLNLHYSIEFVPIISWAVAHQWTALGEKKALSILFVGMSIGSTVHVLDGTRAYKDRARVRFYQPKHYAPPWDVQDSKAALNLIPKDAAVSAQSSYVPHLSLREYVYQYPIVRNAEYILLNRMDRTYPLDSISFQQHLQRLENDGSWKREYDSDTAVLFKRIAEQPVNSQP